MIGTQEPIFILKNISAYSEEFLLKLRLPEYFSLLHK